MDTQKFNSASSTFQLMKDQCYISLSDTHAQFHLHGVFNVPIDNNDVSLSYKPTLPRLLLDFRCVKQKWELLKLYFVENEDEALPTLSMDKTFHLIKCFLTSDL